MTSLDVFGCAERIEAIAAAIYGVFAKQFADDPAAHGLFARLELEEYQHAARIRLLGSQYRKDRKLIERFTGTAELVACLRTGEQALAEALAGTWGDNLIAVKTRLLELEAQLGKAHANLIAQDGLPALRQFFEQLALQDAAHRELLRP